MNHHPAASGRTTALASLLFIACHPAIAYAQSKDPVSEAVSSCSGRQDPGDRLSCYDRVGTFVSGTAAPLRAASPAGPSASTRNYAWGSRKAANPDGTPDLTIGIAAADVLDYGRFLEKPDATLVVRCSAGQASFYVSFGTRLSGKEVKGTLRVDKGTLHAISWTVSASGTSVGTWKPDDAAQRAAELVGGSSLAISIAMEDGRSIVTVFDLAGMDAVAAPLKESCRW